jgi:hypothetical protein
MKENMKDYPKWREILCWRDLHKERQNKFHLRLDATHRYMNY